MLSNTSLTYPRVRDTFGKLRLIPDRERNLEWFFLQIRALGLDGGWLGCWWGNGSPNLWSVRALREVARRGTLRHLFQPYGVQQLRNFYNARKCDRGIPSAYTLYRLLPKVDSLANKWWARPVPAAAVIPASRVAIMFIGSKAFVAGLVNLLWNCQA